MSEKVVTLVAQVLLVDRERDRETKSERKARPTDRALVLNDFRPKGRGRELLPQHGRTAEEQDLSSANHTTGRMVQGQRVVDDVIGLHWRHEVGGAHEELKTAHTKDDTEYISNNPTLMEQRKSFSKVKEKISVEIERKDRPRRKLTTVNELLVAEGRYAATASHEVGRRRSTIPITVRKTRGD